MTTVAAVIPIVQLAAPSTTASLMLLSIFKVFANLRKIRVALGKLRC